jgi:hypothetical protein
MQTNKRPLQLPNSSNNSKKKLKTNESVQANTLYKYFESNKKPPTPPPKQSSLLSFFKRESNVSNETLESNETIEKKTESNAFFKLMNPIKTEKEQRIEEKVENSSEVISHETNNKVTRKCPFYKRIEGSISYFFDFFKISFI